MKQSREPMLNAPWPVLLLLALLVGCFCLELVGGADAVVQRFGFAPEDLARGDWARLVTTLFLHGGWPHLAANSAFALAFATPVSRRLGTDAKGAVVFFVFYLLCGVLSILGYAVAAPSDSERVIGASGAIAGLMGAASRLMWRGPGLAPLTSRPVLAMAGAWLVVNLIVAVVGWSPGAEGAKIAWQAHLAGYVAGLLLFAPTLKLARRL